MNVFLALFVAEHTLFVVYSIIGLAFLLVVDYYPRRIPKAALPEVRSDIYDFIGWGYDDFFCLTFAND